MKEEKKKRKQDNKIVPFEINDEIFTDPNIDQMVKESLIQEADELEAELNADPKLTGVGASDDLLQAIVGKLKEQGIWEEEDEDGIGAISHGNEATKGTGAETVQKRADVERDVLSERGNLEGDAERGSMSERGECEAVSVQSSVYEEAKFETGVEKRIDSEVVRNKTDVEMSTELGVGQYGLGTEENAVSSWDVQHKFESRTESGECTDKSGMPEMTGRSEISVSDEKSLENLYAMLPEEDRRALELGRKAVQKQQRKEVWIQRRKKMLRHGSVAVAVFAIVFGLGMTSEANRRLVQKAWDVVSANFNFRVQTDYTGDEDQIRSKSKEEVAAMEEVSENLGISTISLEMLPKGMEYYNYEIMMDTMEAVLFYTYQDTIFSVTMINVNTEGSVYYMMDESAEFLEIISTDQEYEAKIWETNQELDEEYRAYIAEIDYEDCRYILNGMLPLEEMEKIVKNAFIL